MVWPDARERGRALGIWAGCNGLALAIGPTVGGLLITLFGWPSIFHSVIPLGLAVLILSPLAVPESADPQDRHFDAKGQIVGALSLGCLAFAAIETHSAVWLAAVALIAAAILMLVFVRIENQLGERALVPLEMFRSPRFSGAVAATTGMTFGMYGVLFLLPQTWQTAGRLGPVEAGIALVPMALVFVLVSRFQDGSVNGSGPDLQPGAGSPSSVADWS